MDLNEGSSGSDSGTESERPYSCPIPGCPQRFKRKFTLSDHIKSHTGDKPFVCPVPSCGKSFTTSGNLARHKRLHPWLDRPLECLVDGCDCTFSSEWRLKRHMATHFGASVHSCPIPHCGRVFSTGGNLRRHLKQNHGQSTPRGSDHQSEHDVSSSAQPAPSWLPHPLPLAHPAAHGEWLAPTGYLANMEEHDVDASIIDTELLETLATLFDDDEEEKTGRL